MLPLAQGLAQNNPLPACPKSPNCFRSEVDTKRAIKQVFSYSGELGAAQQQLIQLLSTYPGAKHEGTTAEKIAFSFTTKVGKFTDNVVFYFDEKNKWIHFRSASEVGWSDMGANKRRMKKVRKLWEGRS